MIFVVCPVVVSSVCARKDKALIIFTVTREDMQSLKNDWLTDNVGVYLFLNYRVSHELTHHRSSPSGRSKYCRITLTSRRLTALASADI